MHRKADKQPIAVRHVQILGRGCTIQGDKINLDEKDNLEYLQEVRREMEKCGSDKLFKPFFLSFNGHLFATTPLTIVNDYPDNQKENFINSVVRVVLMNCYLCMGLHSLSEYQEQPGSMGNVSSRVVKTIEEIAKHAEDALRRGSQVGDVMYTSIKKIHEYRHKQFKTSCVSGFFKDTNIEIRDAKAYKDILVETFKLESDIKKALYTIYADNTLSLAYMHYIYRSKIDDFKIMDKAIRIYTKHGMHDAAQFYMKAICLLDEATTETDQDLNDQINQAFEKAQQAPPKTVESWLESIETKGRQKTGQKPKKDASKQKKNKQKLLNLSSEDGGNVSDSTNLSPSTPNQEPEVLQKENTLLPSVTELQKLFEKYGYKLHPRVSRWIGATVNNVRKFEGYGDLSDKEIKWQITVHKLFLGALLLALPYHRKYFFNTYKDGFIRGKSAFANLEIGGTTYEGIFELGISSDKVIYHMMFNEKVKHKLTQLFQITDPVFEDLSENNEASVPSCNKSCTVEKKEDILVCTMDRPTSVRCPNSEPPEKLYIYPNKFSPKSINLAK